MPRILDPATWPRRDAFLHFARFEQPFFSLCTRMDVAPLKAALAARPGPGGLNLACHHLALLLANRHAPFRWRLQGLGAGAQVLEYARVDASTTVLRSDDSFGFATLRYEPRFADFRAPAAAAQQAVRDGPPGFHEEPPEPADDVTPMYFTTLPWVHFTSFAHARPGPGVVDSIPRVAFGRIQAEGHHQWLPVALDVHHALMDGVHAGRWLQDMEALLANPDPWLG